VAGPFKWPLDIHIWHGVFLDKEIQVCSSEIPGLIDGPAQGERIFFIAKA